MSQLNRRDYFRPGYNIQLSAVCTYLYIFYLFDIYFQYSDEPKVSKEEILTVLIRSIEKRLLNKSESNSVSNTFNK